MGIRSVGTETWYEGYPYLIYGQSRTQNHVQKRHAYLSRRSFIFSSFSKSWLSTLKIPAMSYSTRPLPSHLRQGSAVGNLVASQPSPILLARINEKKAELENLKQLRDLSAGLAGQMQMLQEKLSTLSEGTEGDNNLCIFCFLTDGKQLLPLCWGIGIMFYVL